MTFAESNCGRNATKALTDCYASGVYYCTAVQYVDPMKIYVTGSAPIAASAQEDWWLHVPGYADAAHRLTVPTYGGGYFLNQANPAVGDWFGNYLQARYNSYGALLMDDTSASLTAELYHSGYASSQELRTDAALQAAHERFAASITHADGTPFIQIDNSIQGNPYLLPPFMMLNNPSSVTGLMAEDQPVNGETLTPDYASLLDEMAYMDHTGDDFLVLMSVATSPSLRSRRVQAATELLGYSAGHIVSGSDLEAGSGDLAVWPEEGIVPTVPVQSMAEPGGAGCFAATGIACAAGGHVDLQVAPGVFRREFGRCYNRGTPFGRCAVVIDTTRSPVTVKASWLTRVYRHEITMTGADVQSGGSIDIAGGPFSAGRTTVPAGDAVLVSR